MALLTNAGDNPILEYEYIAVSYKRHLSIGKLLKEHFCTESDILSDEVSKISENQLPITSEK